MNLWRRSKSWFHDGFVVQKDGFDPRDYLEHEKEMLHTKYEREKKFLVQHCQKQLVQLKMRFDVEARYLEEKHSRLSREKSVYPGSVDERQECHPDYLKPLTKKNLAVEEDGLEWDPSDELKSYNEDDVCDSWDIQSDISQNSSISFNREQFIDEVESCDSAYSSLASFPLQAGSNWAENGCPRTDEMGRKFEQLREGIRKEVAKECEAKFRQERKFFYSIIDELEESVSLLRKQKEDIVSILESEAKENSKV